MLTVPLTRPYHETGKPVSSLTFRPPRWTEWLEFGDVEEWVPTAAGHEILARNMDAIAKYAMKCMVDADPSVVLPVLDIADSMRLTNAIVDFFEDARRSARMPTSSSSDADAAA